MPDDVAGPFAPDARSSIALIERVVVIEQQQKRQLDDLASIRKTLQDINAELQKLVIQEYQRTGAKWAVTLMGSLLAGAVTIGGALMSGVLWLSGYLR
jgi:hypothetical protein